MKNILLIVTIMIISCIETSLLPDATKKPHEITVHGDTRVDSYYWMRLTDKQKSAKEFDSQTREVVDYIAAENEYTQSSLNHTKKFQDKLFEEIVGRIKKDDVSVPYLVLKREKNTPSVAGKKALWNHRKKLFWMKINSRKDMIISL